MEFARNGGVEACGSVNESLYSYLSFQACMAQAMPSPLSRSAMFSLIFPREFLAFAAAGFYL